MSAVHTILTVARFERKTLLRSWFFRIFAGLFIVGIGIFNVAMFIDSSDAPWIFRALPASLPYANLIILNLGQAIVAVFLASEFLKQDKKNDTVEVIYARSMTNFHYILGKTLGILTVFIILNFIILIIGMGFSFLSGDSAKGLAEFFLYPIIISIPTLVFILGLSFFLMTILRNQAITFILILGYIALTVFYLNQKFYHLFDYIAYHVPLMNSTIGGFGNIPELLMHRGIYLLIGIGLIFFTVFRLQRLPQSNRFKYLPLIAALIFMLAGFFVGYRYVGHKQKVEEEKRLMLDANNKFASYPRVSIEDCSIDLEHNNKTLSASATLTTVNNSNRPIDTLIFSLNPSLSIKRIEVEGKPVSFTRQQHLVIITDSQPVNPAARNIIAFTYSGTINENTHFLDIPPEEQSDNIPLAMFQARKRSAYVNSDFVCLTQEALWYPIAGVTYATTKPAFHQPDFTTYKLTVRTAASLTAISQGECTSPQGGVFKFTNEFPLPKISLLIGNYEKHSVMVDSIEFSLFTAKGNSYYLKEFEGFTDTLPAIIRELKVEYETLLNLKYGFKRLSLAEVPINFALDKHIWTAVSNAVQPEIIFYPERGVLLKDADFLRQKARFEKRMKQNNEQVTPIELQSRMFKRVIRANFMATPYEWYEFGNVVNKYTYSLIPHFYSHIIQIKSDEYPMLNNALEVYLRERNLNYVPSSQWYYRGISNSEKINLELKESSLKELIGNGVRKVDQEDDSYMPLTINDVILAKGDHFFSLLRARFGEKEFNGFISQLITQRARKPFTFEEFDREIENRFGVSVASDAENWYTSTSLAGFIVSNVQTYRVIDGDYTKYQVKVSIANPEPIDGIVEVVVDLDDRSTTRSFTDDQPRMPDYYRRILIPAQSAKDFGVVFNSQPKRLRVFTSISKNLPNTLLFDLTDFDEVKRVPVLDGVNSTPFASNSSKVNEYIVDNEDEGFSIHQQKQESYLKSLINNENSARYKYTGIHVWNPSNKWEPVLQSGFYGQYIRSAYYTASGDGSRYVEWKANLPQGGYYDVYCHIEKLNIYWGRNKRKPNYNYRIYHDDGVEEITLADEELEKGWNYMGTFYISPENARVQLTNKSVGSMVFADAIKWVKK